MNDEVARKALASIRQGHFVKLILRRKKSLYAQFENGTVYLGYADNETISYVKSLSNIKEEQ